MASNSEWISFQYFGGGLNTSQEATEIADDEVSDVLNFEFNNSDDLKARNGFLTYNLSGFSARITSIFNYVTVAAINNIIVTSGNDIFKDTSGVFSSIKGALTLPTNTYWQWRTFTDLAIGVNQGTGANDDVIKWTGAGNAAALLLTGISGAPEGAHSIEEWNNRLWLVFSSHPNRLYFSTLGNPEDWSISGGFIEIGLNDGDKIIGIYAHRGRLFIFKRFKIYQLITSINGQPNTDTSGWKVDLLSRNLGCISRYTIQAVLDDVFFLTDEGVAGINAVQEFGEFKSSFVSRKINELSNLNLAIDTFSAVVYSPKSLYMLAVPSINTGTINNIIYVFDYKNVRSNQGRWTRFESKIINPSVLGIVLVNQKKTLFLGGDTPNFNICKWDDTDIYNDANQIITKKFKSKAFNFGNVVERKEFAYVALGVNFTANDLFATFNIILNEDNRLVQSIALSILNVSSGGEWDIAVWNVDRFNLGSSNKQQIIRQIRGDQGNTARSIQVEFSNEQLSQDIIINDISFLPRLISFENA